MGSEADIGVKLVTGRACVCVANGLGVAGGPMLTGQTHRIDDATKLDTAGIKGSCDGLEK